MWNFFVWVKLQDKLLDGFCFVRFSLWFICLLVLFFDCCCCMESLHWNRIIWHFLLFLASGIRNYADLRCLSMPNTPGFCHIYKSHLNCTSTNSIVNTTWLNSSVKLFTYVTPNQAIKYSFVFKLILFFKTIKWMTNYEHRRRETEDLGETMTLLWNE